MSWFLDKVDISSITMFKGILITAAALLVIEKVSCRCQLGFDQLDSFCFHILRLKSTWAEASTYCRAFGTKLVSIETAEKNKALVDYLQNQTDYSSQQYWTGGNDIAQKGNYVWETTNVNLADGFTDWYHSGPDNGGSEADEHCLEISAGHGWKWNDNECRNEYYPVCEVE